MRKLSYEEALHEARKKAESQWLEMMDGATALAASHDFKNSSFHDDFIDTHTTELAGGMSHEDFVSRSVEDQMYEWEAASGS